MAMIYNIIPELFWLSTLQCAGIKPFGDQPAMKVSGLSIIWESNEIIRDRIRKDRKLCLHPATQRYCEPSRPNAVTNAQVLFPALQKLKDTPQWKLPHLEPIQEEITKLFEKVAAPVEDQYIYTASVEVKRLLGFIKRRASRKEVTKDWTKSLVVKNSWNYWFPKSSIVHSNVLRSMMV